MCGIGGFIGVPRDIVAGCAPKMLQGLAHRGPDGSGIVNPDLGGLNPATLVHTRLAIQDLSSAGFSFCLVDLEAANAWLCRDRLGIKPVYMVRPGTGGLVVASELRALLAYGPEIVSPQINGFALESFLAQGCVFGWEGIVDGVTLLPPATSLRVDANGVEIGRFNYWRLPAPEPAFHYPQIVESGRAALAEAAALHLNADVPVGLFLSGAIDSGVLATLASEQGRHIRTLSIGFDDKQFDETDVAASVARQLGAEHTVCRLSGMEMAGEIGPIIDRMDQPTVDGFNTFVVCRSAKRSGLTVAFSGLAGDELFGGYPTFHDAGRSALAHRLAPVLRLLQFPRLARGRSGVKLAELLLRPNHTGHRLLLRRELFLRSERRRLMLLAERSEEWSGLSLNGLRRLFDATAGRDRMSQISALEIEGYMSHMLLRDADVFSMVTQIELRVPLLNHVFVERAMRMPSALKKKRKQSKALLIELAGSRFPALLRRLPKGGFAFPWRTGIPRGLRRIVLEALKNGDVGSTLRINPRGVTNIWNRFAGGDTAVSPLMVVALLVLQRYVRRHGLYRMN